MTCSSSSTLDKLSLGADVLTFLVNKISHVGALPLSHLAASANLAAAAEEMHQPKDVVPINFFGYQMNINADYVGFIASVGTAAEITAAAAGVTLGSTVGAGLTILGAASLLLAVASNDTARDIATDPEFWSGLKDLIENQDSSRFMKWKDERAHRCNPIKPATATNFTTAQKYPYRVDPLTLDLNGDGLNTVPLKTPPLLFDLNATGIKTSTGWIAPDDGLLAFDRNGNGVIDSGAELFGNATPAYASNGKTADGFAALAQEDSNHDGVVNAQDANFASLRVWQDLNQDGISQTNELTTLDQQGIASFNVNRTRHSQTLPNGNQIADLGSYTRTDGSTGSDGTPAGIADINLAVDTFHRSFVDSIPLTAATQALPDMQGSGMVRGLREAAGLWAANDARYEMRGAG
jgi:hypothetical protein